MGIDIEGSISDYSLTRYLKTAKDLPEEFKSSNEIVTKFLEEKSNENNRIDIGHESEIYAVCKRLDDNYFDQMEVLHSLEQHNEPNDHSDKTATTVASSSQHDRNNSFCSEISEISNSSCSDNKQLMIDLETVNILLRLGAKQEDINAFTQTDINKYTAHKETLKTFSDFGLTYADIKAFRDGFDKLKNFSEHPNMFNDLKAYISKMGKIDSDKADAVQDAVKAYVKDSSSKKRDALLAALKKPSQKTFVSLGNRFFALFSNSNRGSDVAKMVVEQRYTR